MCMFIFKKVKSAITIRDLERNILENKVVPTPDYSKHKAYTHIVQPRGIIFVNKTHRSKPPKF